MAIKAVVWKGQTLAYQYDNDLLAITSLYVIGIRSVIVGTRFEDQRNIMRYKGLPRVELMMMPIHLQDITRILSDEANIAPHEVLYVGDSLVDISTARNHAHCVITLTGEYGTCIRPASHHLPEENILPTAAFVPAWIKRFNRTAPTKSVEHRL